MSTIKILLLIIILLYAGKGQTTYEESSAKDSKQEHRLTTKKQIKETIRREFAPLGRMAVGWGLRVAGCESSYRHYDSSGDVLYNGTCCWGVYQFSAQTYVHFCDGDVRSSTAIRQIKCAKSMYERGLTSHWACK